MLRVECPGAIQVPHPPRVHRQAMELKMYEVVRNIPKPPEVRKAAGGSKYPFGSMEVGASFVVPYGDMNPGETGEKFRARVYKSARNWAARDFKDGPTPGGTSQKKKEFTAALMTEDEKVPDLSESEVEAGAEKREPRWFAGDVIVWRDK